MKIDSSKEIASEDNDIIDLEPETELERVTDPRYKPKNGVDPLTAAEELRVQARRLKGKSKLPRKSKKYDGRAAYAYRNKTTTIMHNFYVEVDLPEFKRALDFSKDPKFQMLLVAINNPNLADCSFPELCKRCNLGINDIASIWRNYQLSRGMIKMMNHMPQVMEDVAEDSKSKVVTCSRCSGEGKVVKGPNRVQDAVCPVCHGDGKVRLMGDKDSRKLAFESAGLLQSAQVNINNQVNVGGNMPTLEDEFKSVERIFDIQPVSVEETANGDGSGKEEKSEGPEVHAGGDSRNAPADLGSPVDRTADNADEGGYDFNAPITKTDPTDYK